MKMDKHIKRLDTEISKADVDNTNNLVSTPASLYATPVPETLKASMPVFQRGASIVDTPVPITSIFS